MRKVTTIVAAAAVALAFTACNKTNQVTPEAMGDSYASVRVDLSSNNLKALNDGDQVDNKGTEAESKVSSMQIVGIDGANWAEADITSTGTTYTGKAKQVSSIGTFSSGLLVNANGLVANADENATYGSEANAVADLAKLADATSGFAMSSNVMGQTIQPNVSETEALTKNMLDFKNVERLVSKGIVQKAAVYDESSEGGKVDFSTVTYAAVNGATKIYAFRNHAGNRTMETSDDNQYLNYTSAIHSSTPAATADLAKAQNLFRRANYAANLGGYAAVKAIDPRTAEYGDTNPGVSNGVYFLENSGDLAGVDMKTQGFYRFAYAKIYATFVPAEVLDIDTEGNPQFVELAGTGKKYKANAAGVFAESNDDDAVEGMLVYPSKKVDDYTPGTTFYVGEKDNRFYISKNAAANSMRNPGQKAFTYTNGRCGYRALWNRQSPDSEEGKFPLVNNASTRRNNIYVLNISKFQKIGMPWDPSDQDDPDLPKPNDPNEPNYPDNPNIEEQDTWIAAKANIVPWNVIGRDVVLK